MEKKRSFCKVLRWILFGVVSLAFGLGIYSWNAKNLTGNAMPMPFGIGVGVVMSGSMEPELSIDDLIIVKASEEYAVGDTVVFQQKNTLIVHKIISMDGETVVTQGTANNTADEPMHVSLLKGKVVCSIGGVGKVVSVINSPFVTIIIILVAGFLLFQSYRKEDAEKQDDEELAAIKKEIENLKRQKNTPEQSTDEK